MSEARGLVPLDACAVLPAAGHKARRLAQARALRLPVPDGVVLLPGAPIDETALRAALRRLGGCRFAVRSSAEAEDQPGRSAAGLFTSLLVDGAEVPAAAAAVRASGEGPLVRACLGAPAPVAVLIQPEVPAARLGTLQLDETGDATAEERPPGEPEWGAVVPRALAAPGDAALLDGARCLAGLVGGPPAQIEYALLPGGDPVFLQVRPAPRQEDPTARWPAPEGAGRFELDREHNPDPLSAAQASLVEWVEGPAREAGLLLRVVRGYLYVARLDSDAAPTPRSETLPDLRDGALRDLDVLLTALESTAPELGAALSAYRRVYSRYVGEIGPLLRRPRARLDQLLRARLGEGLLRHGALLAGLDTATQRRSEALFALGRATHEDERRRLLAEILRRWGAFSPSWDVAVPCDDEAPGRVLAQAAALARGPDPAARRAAAEDEHARALAALSARLPPEDRGALLELVRSCRAAAALGEDDDALFFRAQRAVRRAIRARGAALASAGALEEADQAFDVPIPLLRSPPREGLRACAVAARVERQEARRLVPPDRFEGGRPLWRGGPAPVLRGVGVPGRDAAPVRGRARVVASLGAEPADLPADAVLVLPALLPSWAPQLYRAAALVTDSGGALSHGATLAREAGVPAVVGAAAATRALRDGDEVIVDAVRGLVCCLRGRDAT